MAKDTPQRFAKLVLAELADIHALAAGIHDWVIMETAKQARCSMKEAKQAWEAKRKRRGKRFLDDLLKRVDLP